MSNLKKATMLAAMLASVMNDGVPRLGLDTFPKERNFDAEQEAQNKAKGLTKFTYGQNSLWALNQTNADRKAKKRGWI